MLGSQPPTARPSTSIICLCHLLLHALQQESNLVLAAPALVFCIARHLLLLLFAASLCLAPLWLCVLLFELTQSAGDETQVCLALTVNVGLLQIPSTTCLRTEGHTCTGLVLIVCQNTHRSIGV